MKFRIVVADEDKAHSANEYAHRNHPHLIKTLQKRKKGTVHTEMDDACPNELPNCRKCGDPDFAAACRSKGHCPDCGTKHGIAPDSRLTENGYALEVV